VMSLNTHPASGKSGRPGSAVQRSSSRTPAHSCRAASAACGLGCAAWRTPDGDTGATRAAPRRDAAGARTRPAGGTGSALAASARSAVARPARPTRHVLGEHRDRRRTGRRRAGCGAAARASPARTPGSELLELHDERVAMKIEE
jgi:hypothetical protein